MNRRIILIVSLLVILSQGGIAQMGRIYDGWMEFYNEKILIIGEGLRIREEPNVKSKILGRLSYGDIVTGEWNEKYKFVEGKEEKINGVKNSWLYIRTDKGLTGWVFMEYIACPFIKYDDRVVYVEYKEREFKWIYGTEMYESYKERGEESSLRQKFIIPILVVKYPDKRVEIELSYFKNNNHRLVHLYPFKMKEIKIWDGVYTLIIKADILPWNFDMGAGGEGGSRHNYLFKYDRDKIDRIFEYEDVNIENTSFHHYINCIEFIREGKKVNKIEVYKNYLQKNIAGPDYVNKILPALDESKRKLLNKYYYCLEPRIDDKYYKEIYLESNFFPNFNIEKEKDVFYKYFKSIEEHGYFYFNVDSMEDIKSILGFFKRNKLVDTYHYKIYDYIPDYCLIPDLNFKQLKDAREILVDSGYMYDYDGKIKTYIWDGLEFVEEKK